jgi:hypothetical protein
MRTRCLGLVVVCAGALGCDDSTLQPDAGFVADAGVSGDGGFVSDAGGDGCPARSASTTWGAGTDHATSVSTDEVWGAAGSPHRVASPLSVRAQLTIEPCAVVILSGTGQLLLDAEASRLVAEGTAERPILVRGQATGAANTTRGISATAGSGESIRLAHVTIEGIGDGADGFGDYAVALQSASDQTLHVDTVTIRDTFGGGVGLGRRARFTSTSRGLTVTGTKKGDGVRDGMPQSAPVLFVDPGAVGTLPGGTYGGNEVDHVAVGEFGAAASTLTESSTWADRGVPYFMRAGLDVVPSAAGPAWTLEPGVTLRFRTGTDTRNDHIRVGFGGSGAAVARLVAVGTADRKITFEALSGAAPAWSGVSIFPAARTSRLEHVVIRHTGLESRTMVQDCSGIRAGVTFALAINFASAPGLEPSAEVVRNTTIADAAAGSVGFQRSWIVEGQAGAPSVDLLAPGTGNAVLGLQCRQSGFTIQPPMNARLECASGCE